MDAEFPISQLVRIGTVTAVDNKKRMARVKFEDSTTVSGWLYVPAARPYANYEKDESSLLPWMPRVNASVLALYLPVLDGDGFILGELGPLNRIKQ